MSDNNIDGSDAGDQGSRSPVTGLPVVDMGTVDDEPERQRDNETEYRVRVPLPQGATLYRVCLDGGRRHGFLVIKDLWAHYREQHSRVKVELECGNCGKAFPGLNNWYGHKGRCKGPVAETAGQFRC